VRIDEPEAVAAGPEAADGTSDPSSGFDATAEADAVGPTVGAGIPPLDIVLRKRLVGLRNSAGRHVIDPPDDVAARLALEPLTANRKKIFVRQADIRRRIRHQNLQEPGGEDQGPSMSLGHCDHSEPLPEVSNAKALYEGLRDPELKIEGRVAAYDVHGDGIHSGIHRDSGADSAIIKSIT
jgi:hypothetical protein